MSVLACPFPLPPGEGQGEGVTTRCKVSCPASDFPSPQPSPAGRGGGGEGFQKRARRPAAGKAIQKLIPSHADPKGLVLAPVEKEPSGVRSAAFQRETLSALMALLVTRMRCPPSCSRRSPAACR